MVRMAADHIVSGGLRHGCRGKTNQGKQEAGAVEIHAWRIQTNSRACGYQLFRHFATVSLDPLTIS
jgi:hypothetical protein